MTNGDILKSCLGMCFFFTPSCITPKRFSLLQASASGRFFTLHPVRQTTAFELTSDGVGFCPETKHFDSSRRTPQRSALNSSRRRDTRRQHRGARLRSTVGSNSDASCVTNSRSVCLQPTSYVVPTQCRVTANKQCSLHYFCMG